MNSHFFFALDLPPLEPTTYVSDTPAAYFEAVTIKSTTTTLIVNDAVYAKDLLEDIDRVRCCLFHRKIIKI